MIRRSGGLVEQELTHTIIGAFFETFNNLGWGFLESVYSSALERELMRLGHRVGREVSVRVQYKDEDIAWQRIDMLVDDRVIVEIKATEFLLPHATRQLTNYLRATNLEMVYSCTLA